MSAAVDSIVSPWSTRLRLALVRGGFYFMQRKVISLDGDDTALFENRAFLRERSHDSDQQTFLAAAEACRMGAEVDRVLVRAALAAICQGPAHGRHIMMIGGDTLSDASFPAWLEDQLIERKVSADRLIVQSSMQTVLRQPAGARHLSAALSVLGCGFAMSGVDEDHHQWWLCHQLGATLCILSPDLPVQLEQCENARKRIRDRATVARAAGIAIIAEAAPSARQLAAVWQSGVRLVVGEFLQETPPAGSEQRLTGPVGRQ